MDEELIPSPSPGPLQFDERQFRPASQLAW